MATEITITIKGAIGSGKTTVGVVIADALEKLGVKPTYLGPRGMQEVHEFLKKRMDLNKIDPTKWDIKITEEEK